MSAWPGKYVIGLTGNIATGKSVVRKMMEHLGAYGIDADALGHRAIASDAPGYKPVLEMFGKWVLTSDGQIDRAKLARIVFSDPEALAQLEAIVHPLVGQAVDILVRRSKQKIIVIEAIKLIESELGSKCDSLWVTYAPKEVQMTRLIQKRGMNEKSARQRIEAQPPQEVKTAAAQIVIRNSKSFEDTWRQVNAAWKKNFPTAEAEPVAKPVKGEMSVQRARPRQAGEVASLINSLSEGRRSVNRGDIMAAFGEKAYLLLTLDDKVFGLIGWKVENLVARIDELYLKPGINSQAALQTLMNEVERASSELQCEISLVFIPADFARRETAFRTLGYQQRTVQSLAVRPWQEAAIESMPAGSVMLFKQLRSDRVLRPV